MAARKGIPSKVRRKVIARDGMTCHWCGISVQPNVPRVYSPTGIHLDHLVPWAAGGTDAASNLVVACANCNIRRSGPRGLGRSERNEFRWEYAGGNYWWRDGYTPPAVLASDVRHLMKLGDYSAEFGETCARTIARIMRGGQAATADGPIMVEWALRPRRRVLPSGRRLA